MSTLGQNTSSKMNNLRTIFGIILILAGSVLFLDRYLKTGWLSLIILPAVGLFLYLWGIKMRHVGMILAGGLLSGFGAGTISAWGSSIQPGSSMGFWITQLQHPLAYQIGTLSLFTGIGWLVVVLTTSAINLTPIWWGLIPAGILGSLGACLLFSPVRWVDLVLYLAAGTGLPMLFWGLTSRLFGLVIPGCLLPTIGAGIYTAWKTPAIGNSLVQTGVMLVWFALGWVLITMGGRITMHRYIWWPLIPGGILAMVGMGLYIGGDPKHALGFIGNTGSIALVIFGLYLLLMRKSIHH